MTAVGIITDHNELENRGENSHEAIDEHISETPFLVVSGSSGNVPASARVLSAGSGVTITDDGAGSSITISVEPSSDGYLSQEKESSSVTVVPDKKTMLVFGEFTLYGDASIHLSGSATLAGIG